MAKTGSAIVISLIYAALGGNIAVRAADPVETSTVTAHDQGKTDEIVKGDRERDKGGGNARGNGNDKSREKTPEEKMQARFPQPAKVGHLIGLPVLDENDSTIGYVQQVVRSPEGKIQLIVPYGKLFGWARDGWLMAWGRRPVAVPIEVVAILARQINAVDMDRGAFDKAPTWVAGSDQSMSSDQTIKIALGRR